MKFIYIFIEFLCIFFFLLLPPVFSKSQETIVLNGSLSIPFVVESLIVALLLFQQFKFLKDENVTDLGENEKISITKNNNNCEKEKVKSFSNFVINLRWGTLTFGVLILLFAFFKIITLCFFSNSKIMEAESTVLFPENVFQWIVQILIFLAAAVNEEVLYRYFFPEFLLKLLAKISIKNKIFVRAAVEFLSALIFCLGHVYMGISAVLNALCASVILRLCFIKTKTVFPGSAAHFLYNIIQLVISFVIANSVVI